MTKPIVAERFTPNGGDGFRVSIHNGRTQIEIREGGEWVRIYFGSNADAETLADTIDDARDALAQQRKDAA